MAQRTLGTAGGLLAAGTYLFHSYALLVAYVARGSQIASEAGGVPQLPAALAFSLVLGGLCYGASGPALERINGVLLAAGMAAFVGLLGIAGSAVDFGVLAKADWSEVPPTIPIIGLAFVYHNVVPVIVNSLEYDRSKVRSALLGGVLIPWAMYLVWDGIILGSMDNLAAASAAAGGAAAAAAATAATAAAAAAAAGGDGGAAAEGVAAAGGEGGVAAAVETAAAEASRRDPLDLLLRGGGPVVAPLVKAFSFLAVATSYIGFVLSVVDFLPDLFKPLAGLPREVRYALVVLPPVVFATANPAIFFAALEIAGTYGVMTLYGVLPAAMSWSERYGGSSGGGSGPASTGAAGAAAVGREVVEQEKGAWPGLVERAELLPGGKAVLLLTAAAAAAVVVSRSLPES